MIWNVREKTMKYLLFVSFSFSIPTTKTDELFNFEQLQKPETAMVTNPVDKEKPAMVPVSNSTFNTDSFLSSLNICAPTQKTTQEGMTKPATTLPTNIFSGLAAQNTTITAFSFNSPDGSAEAAKPLGSATGTFPTQTSMSIVNKTNSGNMGFSFSANSGINPTVKSVFTSAVSSTTITPITTPKTSSTSLSNVSTSSISTTSITNAGTVCTTASTFSFGNSTGLTSATSIFGTLSLMPINSAAATPTVSTNSASNEVTSSETSCNVVEVDSTIGDVGLFKTNELSLGENTPKVNNSQATHLFGGATTLTPISTTASPLFQSIITTGANSTVGNVGNTPTTTSANIFGGIPKQETTVQSSGLFGSSIVTGDASSNNVTPITSNNNIFAGSNLTAFSFSNPATTKSSIFSPSTNIFASNTANGAGMKTPERTNIFASPTSGNNVASGDNLFAKSSFGLSSPKTGSVFGGSGDGSFQPSRFSSFAQPSPASGGSLFGGAANSTFSFGSPPPQQQQSAFSKPVFGGPPAFGSPPSGFGAQPTFGGAPTFSSPKGFTSFASSPTSGALAPNAANATPAFGNNATPSNTGGNIFETLGSSSMAPSFGNLAESTQQPAQVKPTSTFGG